MAEQTASQSAPTAVKCPPAKDPAVRYFIMSAMLIGIGAWFFYDAYVAEKYPYKPNGNINDLLNYAVNHYAPWLLVPAGIALMGWGIYFLMRTMVADEQGIGWKDQDCIPWTAIDELDAGRLKSKGILRLRHGEKTLTLDSWKLQNFKQLVDFVDKHVPADKRVS